MFALLHHRHFAPAWPSGKRPQLRPQTSKQRPQQAEVGSSHLLALPAWPRGRSVSQSVKQSNQPDCQSSVQAEQTTLTGVCLCACSCLPNTSLSPRQAQASVARGPPFCIVQQPVSSTLSQSIWLRSRQVGPSGLASCTSCTTHTQVFLRTPQPADRALCTRFDSSASKARTVDR